MMTPTGDKEVYNSLFTAFLACIVTKHFEKL